MSGILLIDAEQPFADQMVGALRARGFAVKHLDDGKDGLDFARDTRPDLIVLCVELPKMSGYSICNKLKKDGDLKNIPLLITSKEATPETFAQHKKLKTRAEEYLIKPFSEADLLEKIGSLIPMPAGGASSVDEPSSGLDAFDALDSLGGEQHPGATETHALDAPDDGGAPPSNLDGGLGLNAEEEAMLAGLDALGGPPADAIQMGSGSMSLDDELPELGGSVQDENLPGFDQAFEALATVNVTVPGDALSAALGRHNLRNDSLEKLEPLDHNVDATERQALVEVVSPSVEARSERSVSSPVASLAAATPPPPPAAAMLVTHTGSGSMPVAVASSSMHASSSSSSSAADLAQIQTLRRESNELKGKVAELEARLRTAEDVARTAQSATAAAGTSSSSTAREVLNLKEQLRAKDKELLALRDEVFEKEKGTVDLAEEVDRLKADAAARASAVAQKEAEVASLQARVTAVSEERDELEQQVHGRLQQAEQERDHFRGDLERTRGELERTKAEMSTQRGEIDRLRAADERARGEIEEGKRVAASAKTASDARIREIEATARDHEQRYLKAYQRLKTEETLREKAKKAVEIAFTVLSGDVEGTGETKGTDLDQLGAE